MSDLFDLKKYLAQVSHMEQDEVTETILQEKSVGAGLDEYLEETHSAGATVIGNYITGEEIDLLVAAVGGISTQRIMVSPVISPDDKMFAVEMMLTHPSFLKALILSVMCSTVGIMSKEEWR